MYDLGDKHVLSTLLTVLPANNTRAIARTKGPYRRQAMLIKTLDQSSQFQAPKHWDMRSLRLQLAGEPGGPKNFSVSLSYFLPGGGAKVESFPSEKVYIVLSGRLRVTLSDETGVLETLSSCVVPANVERSVINEGVTVAEVLVITGVAEASDRALSTTKQEA